MSATTAELSQITFSPEEVFGHRPKDSFAALMHPDRAELRASMLSLEQEIAAYVDHKLKSTLHVEPASFTHPDYPDLQIPAYARDYLGLDYHVTKIDIPRLNDERLLYAATPRVHYMIKALEEKGQSLSMSMVVFEGGDCQISLDESSLRDEKTVECEWGDNSVYYYKNQIATLDTRDLTNLEDFYQAVDENTDFGKLLLKMYDLME